MRFEAEQFLHANVQRRRTGAIVVERKTVPRRRGEVRRRIGIETLARIPRQQPIERIPEIIRTYFGELGFPREIRLQPCADACVQCCIGKIRQILSASRPQKSDALANLQLRFRPRQLFNARASKSFCQHNRNVAASRNRALLTR